MFKILLILQFFLLLMIGYFIFYKKENSFINKILFIFIKTHILFLIVFYNKNFSQIIFIIYLFFIIPVLFLFIKENKERNVSIRNDIKIDFKKEYILFLLAIILLLIFSSSCTNIKINYPTYKNEIKFKFTPGCITTKDKNTILIANENENKIYFYDLKNFKITKTIRTGNLPVKIKIFNKKIFIVNYLGNSITVYDLENEIIENLPVSGQHPSSIEFNKEKNLLYVANMGTNNITIIDLITKTIKNKIKVGKWPADIYLSPDKYLYVCCKYTNTIEIIDAEREKHIFTKVHTGISPTQILPINKKEFAVLNEWEYVFNYKSTIVIFNRLNYKVKESIQVDGGIFYGTISKSNKYMIISVPEKDKIIFVDVKARKKIHELNLEDDTPKYLALSEDGKQLFISTQNSKKIIVIDLKDFS